MERPERRFYLRLAREFGYLNVDEMLASTTAKQLTEWRAEYQLEPWGEELFYRFMSRAFVQLSAALGARFEASDFMPDFWSERQASSGSVMEMAHKLRAAGFPVKFSGGAK